jgi:hypothetical protein
MTMTRKDIDRSILDRLAREGGRNAVENLLRYGDAPGSEDHRLAGLQRLTAAGLLTWEPTHSGSGYYSLTEAGRTTVQRLAAADGESGPDWTPAAERYGVLPYLPDDVDARDAAHGAAEDAILTSAGLTY